MSEANDTPPKPQATRARWRRRLRTLAIVVAGCVAVLSIAPLVIRAWMNARTRSRVFTRVEDVPSRTVAIVPGALVFADGRVSAVLEDRLQAALDLYRAGRVSRVLVSGDHGKPTYDEVNAMLNWMVAHGVPPEHVFTDHAGFRTLDTMVRAAQVFDVRDAVVCTQKFHMARSLFLAEQAGINAVGLVADRREYMHATSNSMRELIAASVAVLDRWVFGTRPRFLGPAIPITGSALPSHDRT